MIKVGLCGVGFMGRMHAACYAAIPDVRIVAIADDQAENAQPLAAKHGAAVFSTARELITRAPVDLVDICLPTYLHCEAALLAAKRGLDCLCEKPIARDPAQANRMVKAIRDAKIKFMVGHVLRFWPEYQLLKQYTEQKTLGPLVSLEMRRFGEMPVGWKGWFRKPALSGGAALDLHIHDVDYALYLLGKPKGLDSVGVCQGGAWNQIATHYHYPAVAVTAQGGWCDAPEPFEMAFRAVFAKGVLSYSSKSQPLARYEKGKPPALVSVPQVKAGEVQAGGNISSLGGYFNEVKYFVDCLKAGRAPETATAEDARDAVALVFREMASAQKKLRKRG
ncbi:MAG: Gfo/Idh/MocA family oxidoreductase [Candidatus Brocadiia bacterium]|jgi:predicted dehydrogenase